MGGLGQSIQTYPNYTLASNLPKLIQDAIAASERAGHYLGTVIQAIAAERDALKLENDALKAELDRIKNFKEWFADGKEPAPSK